jgi:uncharacterized Ntn-hydrolase superfamily protein
VTFSIVARSPDRGMFGVAISSSSPAVGARCAHARAGVGAVASQNITDPALGGTILDDMAQGQSAAQALEAALSQTPHGAYRQLLVVGRRDPPVIHSGARALGIVGAAIGADGAAAGNLLAHAEVPAAMIEAFSSSVGHLAARLLTALRAGVDRGGEAGPLHSASVLVVGEPSWPIVDLRMDWTEGNPVTELWAIWNLYAPQIDDYIRRAKDPGSAPRFGVPGDT